MTCTFQATIGGESALLIGLRDEDKYISTMITYKIAVIDAVSEILGRERRRKSRGSPEMLSISVMRGEI